MKLKILPLRIAIVFAVAVASAGALSAQEFTPGTALNLINKNAASLGLSKTDLRDLRISSAYVDAVSGATLVYAQQTYMGIDVFNSIQTYAFKDQNLVSAAGGRVAKIERLVNARSIKPAVTAGGSVGIAAAALKIAPPALLAAPRQTNGLQEFDFGKLDISSVNVKSRLIWLTDESAKSASLSWQVEVQPEGTADYWLVNIDAVKGGVISKINLNVSCNWGKPAHTENTVNDFAQNAIADDNVESVEAINSAKYKVIPFPAENINVPGGTPAVKSNPWLLAGAGNNSGTLTWNYDGTTTYDSSRGNNVLAQEDLNGNNGFGLGAHSTQPAPDLLFKYTPNFNQDPTTATNQQFALTNLFYWNNIMHDISYQYGFDEASGNFQANNLGRGGLGNDYVFADGQDGSGTDNANFSTPPDGSNPRMQMYLFDGVPSTKVIKPASYAGLKNSTESGFSSNNKLTNVGPVQNKVVLYADNAGNTTHQACTAAVNPSQLKGKIALIDRGTCAFTTKVLNAQNAGAIAAIVADNIPGEYPITMGGTDNTIKTPAVMVSFETGEGMKSVLDTTTILVVKLAGGVRIDGDLDNGVICHEATHGISNRLTGGPNNTSCLNNKEQMGEGWSDYVSLMVTQNWATTTLADSSTSRGIGTYVLGQAPDGPGIRTYPYSHNLAVNPWTYDSLKLSSRFASASPDPHIIGEVWCNMLWVMTWNLAQQMGTVNKNLYKATGNGFNNVALQLVIEGLKLQPCSPGFVDGRNAILKADTLLYGAAHSAVIWRSFASRGLGYSASEGSSNNIKDGVAAYDLPPAAIVNANQPQQAVAENTGIISIAPNPATNNVILTFSGNKKQLSVDLLSAKGEQLNRYSMTGERLQINLPALASGMYYLWISGDGVSETRKLIIQ
jgi:hypothetical protein